MISNGSAHQICVLTQTSYTYYRIAHFADLPAADFKTVSHTSLAAFTSLATFASQSAQYAGRRNLRSTWSGYEDCMSSDPEVKASRSKLIAPCPCRRKASTRARITSSRSSALCGER